MPIEDFHPRPEPSDAVYFTENWMVFPGSLLRREKLEGYEYVRLGVDAVEKRIYFAFEFEPVPDALPFYPHIERALSRVVPAAELLTAYPWIRASGTESAKALFPLHRVDPAAMSVYRKYQYYIDLQAPRT